MYHQGTISAIRFSGGAAIPTEQYDPVAEIIAFFWRKNFTKLHFNFLRVLAFAQSQSAANADAMGIADHAARLRI